MTPVVATAIRVSVILLAIAGTAGHIVYLDELWWHKLGLTATMARSVTPATLLILTAHAVVTVVCAVLGVALVLNERQRARAGRVLGAAFGAWSYLMAYSGVTMLFRPDPGLTRDIFEGHFLVVEIFGLAGLMHFTAIFPRPLSEGELEPSATLPPILLPFHLTAVFMRRPWAPWVAGSAILGALWSWTVLSSGEISDAGLSPIMDVVRFLGAGLVVMNLRRAWHVATEGDRDQLMWIVAALSILLSSLAVLIGGNVLVAVTGFPEPNVAWRPILLDLGLIGCLFALAMSILHREATDPAQLARGVGSAAAIVTVGLFLAAGLEAFFAGGILAAYSLRAGVGTAMSFAIVLSTHRAMLRLINRVVSAS